MRSRPAERHDAAEHANRCPARLHRSVKAVSLSWVPDSDNVQIDHYQILRNGVPLSATDANTSRTPIPPGSRPPRRASCAPSTPHGNVTNSDAKTVKVPDWSPPTQPVLNWRANGTTVTLTWNAAADDVGVVGFESCHDKRPITSMTGAVHKYIDRNVKPGAHLYVVQARDEQGNATGSIARTVITKATRPGDRARPAQGGRGAAVAPLLAGATGPPARGPARRRRRSRSRCCGSTSRPGAAASRSGAARRDRRHRGRVSARRSHAMAG